MDNHFTGKRDHTTALLNRIIEERIPWRAVAFTRLEVARDEELLALLNKAKVNTLYIGLESFDDSTLKHLNKHQTQEDMRKAIKTIQKHGLRIAGSFVLGSDADSVETIRATIDSAIEEDIDIGALFALSGYPEINSPTIPINRFFMPTWERLDGNFVCFLPKNMKPSTLQREFNRAYKKFYSPKRILSRLFKGDFRTAIDRTGYYYNVRRIIGNTERWAEYLETVEATYYDENERLIEERLGEGIYPAKYPGTSLAAGWEQAVMPVPVSMSDDS